jgi:undecaprenyl-diphosphatase
VALFSAVGAFVVLTFMAKSTPFFPVDLRITMALQSIDAPLFASAMNLISWPGFLPQSAIIPAFVAVLLYRFGLRWEAISALVAAFLPAIINVVVKEWIRRPRPAVDLVDVFRILESYSFPSGHVMFYIGFFGFLWFLVFVLLKPSFGRTLLLIALGSLIALVGVSRIYLGQHWASDILGASLLGGLVLVFILQVYRWGKKRFFINQPDVPG